MKPIWMPVYSTELSLSVNEIPERSQIPDQFKWKLTDIFPSDKQWEEAFRQVETSLPDFLKYRGQLHQSAAILLECLQFHDKIEQQLKRLFLYAGLKNDEDSRKELYQAMRDRVVALQAKFSQSTAFIRPEILAIPESTLRQFLEAEPGLQMYRHLLEDMLRFKAHTLPPEQENLLALAENMAYTPYNVFSNFNNADLRFPTITDEQGQKVTLSHGRLHRLLQSRSRAVRRKAFLAYYRTYQNWLNTLSATLSGGIKKNIFYSQARRYPSALEAALHQDNIPAQVYENVISTIHQNLEPLHRYHQLRRKALQLPRLLPYDLFVPLVPEQERKISYPEAQQILLQALQPLGNDYLEVVNRAFQEGWIDVYENKGKRSGAYSWSTYGTHPYILLNYQDTLNDLFTLAHEMGHALHSHFSQTHQPYIYSDYTIFVAEVASTLNELLLMHYLLETTTDRPLKLHLLNHFADQIRGTVYIQTLFAEFEKWVHEQLESGQALTAPRLNEVTGNLYTQYFGPAFSTGKLYGINWCRIPHFYYNFYVYKYVTGYSAAVELSRQILRDTTGGARERYLEFLSRGSSDYSLNLLKDAGVDLTSPQPIISATRLFSEIIDEMSTLMNINLP